MDSNYKNLIWTNHALSRMRERDISQSDAYATWSNPDKLRYAKARHAWVYHKNINRKKIEVVAKKNEKGEWVIISVWSKVAHPKRVGKKEFSLTRFFKRLLKL